MSGSYYISAPSFLTAPSQLLRDLDVSQPSPHEVAALVASGDGFVTLAIKLEILADSLDKADKIRPELEGLASTLFYMQRYYKISPKKPDHRGGIF